MFVRGKNEEYQNFYTIVLLQSDKDGKGQGNMAITLGARYGKNKDKIKNGIHKKEMS